MSDIRTSFYEAINKANNQRPKQRQKKTPLVEKISIEQQIQNIINESNHAVIKDTIIINNQPLVDWIYQLTKLTTEEVEMRNKIDKELNLINKLRDEARKKYNRLNRVNEFTAFSPSAAASSSSAGAGAGAGGGKIFITVDPSTNTYVVDDYIDNYLV